MFHIIFIYLRDSNLTNGLGVVENVVIRNIRLSDAVLRADIDQMEGNCKTGEALDRNGNHVRAHQVSVWIAKLPESEIDSHLNIIVDNIVSMNSRADGLNIHGSVKGFVLQNSHIENSGDDCIGIWSTQSRVLIHNVTTVNCAVTAGIQQNWGSCVGTYAFTALRIDGLKCYDPFADVDGCNPRTHYTAIHLNHAFAEDCMPADSILSLKRISYFFSGSGKVCNRPRCGQCRSCCGHCSFHGFDNLKIEYLDATVPNGTCMLANAGC